MKKLWIVLLAMLSILSLSGIAAGAGSVTDQVIVIGQNGIYDLNAAVNALKANAGDAVIYLTGNVNQTMQVELPAGLEGLNSLTIASYNGAPVSVSMGGSVFCANGIPLTIENGVTISGGFLVGGSCIAQVGSVTAKQSVLIINGSADYVVGGGLAMNSGAFSNVQNVSVVVNGAANVVYGGGYAYNGGLADVSGMVNLILTRSSNVKTAVYGGGFAGGSGSNAPVNESHVVALGTSAQITYNKGQAENDSKAQIGPYEIQQAPKPVEFVNPNMNHDGVPLWGGQTVPPAGTPTTVMYVGPGQMAQNFTDAVNLLPPQNAGNVTFLLTGNFSQNHDVAIPRNRGITSIAVSAAQGRVTVTWPEDIGFFANGIPMTMANSVVFNNGIIYGGANVSTGQQSSLQTTYLDISGTVNKVVAGSKAKGSAASAHVMNTTLIFRGKANGWLYNGGAALFGGYSVVDGTASLIMMQGATAEQSISGGGYAFGSGSESVVANAYMDVSGSIVYAVFMGGYADQSSSATTTGQCFLNLQTAASVGQSVWYGGRAFKNSSVYLGSALGQIMGRVGATVHREGRASDGGSVTTREIR